MGKHLVIITTTTTFLLTVHMKYLLIVNVIKCSSSGLILLPIVLESVRICLEATEVEETVVGTTTGSVVRWIAFSEEQPVSDKSSIATSPRKSFLSPSIRI